MESPLTSCGSLAQAIKEDTSLLPEMADNLAQIAGTVGKIHIRGNGMVT